LKFYYHKWTFLGKNLTGLLIENGEVDLLQGVENPESGADRGGWLDGTDSSKGLIMSIDAFNNAIVDIDSIAGVLGILARLDFAAPVSGEAVFVVPNGFSYIVNTSVEKTVAFTPMLSQFLPRAAYVRKPSLFLGRGASGKDGQKDDTGKFLFHHAIGL
jgi:hypothetical protein